MPFDGPSTPSSLQPTDSSSVLGDAAFRGLFVTQRGRLMALATRMTGSTSDAEEVVQEAFLQAWRARGRFAGQSQPSTWLYRITANAGLMHLRSRRRRPLDLVDDIAAIAGGDSGTPDPLIQNLERERRQAVVAAVNRLPRRDRDLVDAVLADRDDEAVALGSAAARKSRLSRARRRLRCDAGLAAVI